MIIEKGQKVHVIYRALYENSGRRHFLGEVQVSEGPVCRLEGYVFVYDKLTGSYIRKPEKRITIINLSESGYVVNVINSNIILDDITYKYVPEVGLHATDGREFALNINEFGSRS